MRENIDHTAACWRCILTRRLSSQLTLNVLTNWLFKMLTNFKNIRTLRETEILVAHIKFVESAISLEKVSLYSANKIHTMYFVHIAPPKQGWQWINAFQNIASEPSFCFKCNYFNENGIWKGSSMHISH